MKERLTFPTAWGGRDRTITHYYGPPMPYKMGEIRKNYSGSYDALTSEFVDDLIRSATEQK